MTWLDDFKAAVGDYSVEKNAPKSAVVKKHPRDMVARHINNSISYFIDNKYRLPDGKRKGQIPELCYVIDGSRAKITITYARSKLKLIGDDTTVSVNMDKLVAGLRSLKDSVEAGKFDDKLEEIRSTRAAKLKEAKDKRIAGKK
jgi:hypothetical protein